jgi:uncharacterized protein (TIGR00297 family)
VDGAVAAAIVGAAVFATGGWSFAAALFAFFLPAVALSRFGSQHNARDARQVLANGGVAAACAVAFACTRSPVLAAAFAGALAAAAADTWGTELGTLARGNPRSIATFRTVARGLSGGVTTWGTFAEIGGALVVGLVAWAVGIAPWWVVGVAGFAGALADSLFGATLQALYYCSRCERNCETHPHLCGSATSLIRGWGAIDNDAVNAIATLTGALAAGGIAALYTAAF